MTNGPTHEVLLESWAEPPGRAPTVSVQAVSVRGGPWKLSLRGPAGPAEFTPAEGFEMARALLAAYADWLELA